MRKPLERRSHHLSHVQTIALGFFLMIFIGTILLMLPIATKSRQPATIMEALFTATSASCVTGLVLQDTASYWSLFGQIVILAMIQIGGLGFMTIATMFFLLLRKRIGLKQREVMSESISVSQIGGILSLTKVILLGTLIIEGTGAILLSIRFVPMFDWKQGIYYGVFHAVSAFCNAGFDLMGIIEPYSSLVYFQSDTLVNLTIMALITIGGLGFLVWDDILKHRLHVRRYRLHTKLVLVCSAVLTFGGALMFWMLERDGLSVGMDGKTQVLTVLFDAVTARTAGFNTTDTAALSDGSKLLTMILMFIGGSPGSTAGGIKTTTIFLLLLYALPNFRHGNSAEVFGRRIVPEDQQKAAQVFFTNLTLAMLGALSIFLLQDLPFSDVLFEVFSAMGTVGMTTGITRELSTASCAIIAFLMYCGRVGSVSFALALMEKRAPARVQSPAENISVG